MQKSTKIAIAVASVLALGSVIYWFVAKRKEVKEEGGVGLFGKKGKLFKMGYLMGDYVHVATDDRAKANGIIVEGKPITIKGTNFDGDYVVGKIWKDSNGNLGAFTTSPKAFDNIKNKDRSFEGKGKIIVKQ
tara:strand:+ start:447 stop:842 length:396 start_codon:yes stop_codon:yes gene_type:complete